MLFRFLLVALLCGAALARPQAAAEIAADVDSTAGGSAVESTADGVVDGGLAGAPDSPVPSDVAIDPAVEVPDVAIDPAVEVPDVAIDPAVEVPDITTDESSDVTTEEASDVTTEEASDVTTEEASDVTTEAPTTDETTDLTTPASEATSPEASGDAGVTVSLTVVLELNGFGGFANYIKELGLEHLINGPDPVTVFALPDAAVQKIKDLVNKDIEFKKNLIKSLILGGKHKLEELKEKVEQAKNGVEELLETPQTLNNTEWSGNVYPDGDLVTGGGTITNPDLEAVNGIVHGINDVAVPLPGTIADGTKSLGTVFSNFIDKIKNRLQAFFGKINDAAGDYTFIAPCPREIATTLANLLTGKLSAVRDDLNSRLLSGKNSWEDLQHKIGESISASGGQSHLIRRIDENTIGIGRWTITRPSLSVEYSNGFSYQSN